MRNIAEKIQYEYWLPDQILSEAMICKELNVSRTPVREALIALVSDGVLTYIPHKGYKIQASDDKKKRDTYLVLGALDALAATSALPNMTQNDLRGMREIVDKIDIAIKYHNYPDYYFLQDAFHTAYIDKCDNDVLIESIRNLKSGAVKQTYASQDKERLFEVFALVNEEHKHIISLFESGDPAALEYYLRNTHWATRFPDMI